MEPPLLDGIHFTKYDSQGDSFIFVYPYSLLPALEFHKSLFVFRDMTDMTVRRPGWLPLGDVFVVLD
jgi:hypothetical protein